MTGSRIFLDTAPLIYLLEDHPEFCHRVSDFLADAWQEDAVLQTSVLTFSEYCVQPLRKQEQHLVQGMEEWLINFDVSLTPITRSIALAAARLRAKYTFLQGIDALQLAAAQEVQADIFYTNDRKLQRVEELRVVLVTDL